MIPWERDIYIKLLLDYLEKEAEKAREENKKLGK